MKKLILVRIGEIALKGLNRTNFEHMLAKNMKAIGIDIETIIKATGLSKEEVLKI